MPSRGLRENHIRPRRQPTLSIVSVKCVSLHGEVLAAQGALGDESRAALSSEIRPQPLGAYLAAILLLRERHHMDGGPEPEGYKPAETDSTDSMIAKFFPTTAMLPLSK